MRPASFVEPVWETIKKGQKKQNVPRTFSDELFKCQLDYLPSMEQQEDGHRGGQTQYFYQMLSLLDKMLAFWGGKNKKKSFSIGQ